MGVPGDRDRRRLNHSTFVPAAAAVIVFAVAMGYLESAVVVYLRGALGLAMSSLPTDTSTGLAQFESTEAARELATLVMIATAGWLAGRAGWERLAWSAVIFGTWDIVYYAGLFVISGWPPSLDTWDVLFLVPVPWVGPVWAPMAVSVALVSGGLLAAQRLRAGYVIRVHPGQLAAALLGAVLVFASFVVDGPRVLAGDPGAWTGWPLLVAGIALGAAGTLTAIAGASTRRSRGFS